MLEETKDVFAERAAVKGTGDSEELGEELRRERGVEDIGVVEEGQEVGRHVGEHEAHKLVHVHVVIVQEQGAARGTQRRHTSIYRPGLGTAREVHRAELFDGH